LSKVQLRLAATKKYTDLKALDATVLREFIDRIEIAATPKYSRKHPRRINIVYNFIGAFDFISAIEKAGTESEAKKSA
jgi:hypothetical protein